LIVKLMEEATAETEHKGWCDSELGKNKITRAAKSEEANKLAADVEDLTSDIAQLAQDIADLSAGMMELDKAMAAATEERQSSKAKNEATIQEAKDAQEALERGVAVLKEYYAKSAEATSLVQKSNGKKQQPEMDAPETFDKPYTGMLPEGGNIADFLEVILSDFARLEAETSTNEAAEDEQHETYMFESKKDRALKENEQGHKQNKKTDQESNLHSTTEELKSTQDQLDKATSYYDKLKPTCLDSGITYEERVKRREVEMQSLQEALQILSGADIAR